jgi:hypothetical protein
VISDLGEDLISCLCLVVKSRALVLNAMAENLDALKCGGWGCRRFDPGGSLDRRVNLSLRVPAQMGWREMEHKGENAARVTPRQGGVLAVGVTSV